MDAAKKPLKACAFLLAFSFLMAAPAWAQPKFAAPSAVTVGSSGFSDLVPVSCSGCATSPAEEINFSISADYSGDTTSGSVQGWLKDPSGTNYKTPTVLTFSLATTSGLNSGATVRLTLTPIFGSPAGVQPVTILVTFNSNSPGGGGSSTLAASPGAVSLSATPNNSASTSVGITTNIANNISISAATLVSGGVVNWLSATLSTTTISTAAGATLTITAASANLTAGATYTGTVTVTPTAVGTPLNIIVTFIVAGPYSSAPWTVTPGTIGWPYTTDTNIFPAQLVTVTNSRASTATVVYNVTTFSSGSWLVAYQPSVNNSSATSLSGISIANPFGLTVGPQANNLLPGLYTGTAVISDASNANSSITLNVTLVVTGGSSTTITVTPNPISFNLPSDGAPQSRMINVTSPVGGTLSVTGSIPSATGSFPAGLSFVSTSPTIAAGGTATFTVNANPAGLPANTYSGRLTISIGGQTTTVNVSLIVGGGGTGTTAVAPIGLNFFYQLGKPPNFLAIQKLVITGTAGAWSSSVSTANGVNWLVLNPKNGSALPDPADDSQAPKVSIDPTGLVTGRYDGKITIFTPGGGSQDIAVSLTVGPETIILPTPGSLIFTAKTGQPNPKFQTVYFVVSDSTVSLKITAVSNNPWIAVTNTDSSVAVTVDQTGLSTGVYSGSVAVTQAGAENSPLVVPVVLVVNTGGSGGTVVGGPGNVTVSPTSLTFGANGGSSPATQTLSVTSASASAGIAFTVQASTTDGASWLSTNAGASNTTPFTGLIVTVSSNALAAGSYTGKVVISPTGGTAVTVPVSLTVSPQLSVSATPALLNFAFQLGDNPPPSQTLTVSGTGPALAFSVKPSSTGDWIAVSHPIGTTPGTVTVSVNTTGISAGTYTGTVLVAGVSGATGSTTVDVTLTVTLPVPTLNGVGSAASYATGAISPGELITLFATDPVHPIGPATAATLALDSTGKVSTSIGGVQVLVNGFECPMVYASAKQVSAVVPYEVKQFANATVLVKFIGQRSNGVFVTVATTVPGIFTANSSGTGPGAILNADTSFNAPDSPATRGDTVAVYLTGEGETSPAGITGKVTTVAPPPQPLTPAPVLPVTVTVGGQPADWSFAGEAPSLVSGVMQLNVVLPTNISAGDQPIVISIGGNPSKQGVTVSVK